MKITIYSTKSCVFCKKLKEYLDEKGLAYEEKLADSDEAIAQELFQASHQFAVPYTIVEKADGSTAKILGFNRPEIDAAISA